MQRQSNGMGWLFTSPYLIYGIIFFFVPLIFSFFLSLTEWNLISPDIEFVGFSNFLEAVQSPGVRSAFWVTYKFMLVFIPFVVVLSLSVALLVHSLPKFRGLFLVGFFLPYLSSGVVTSLIVNGMISYNGPISTFLRNRFGMEIDWLGTPLSALTIVSLMIAWKFTGYYALIITSGLESINQEIYEAAKIDGANSWQIFWKITIPQLYPALYTVLILAIGVTFGIFTEVFQLTGGGPDYATNTWQMEIYSKAFVNLEAGYASAVALIASIVTFISIFIIRKILEAWGRKHGWE